MKISSYIKGIIAILIISTVVSCAFLKKAYNTSADAVSNVNVFPYTEDIVLGKEVKKEILSAPGQYPILDRSSNPKLYNYIEGLKNKILQTNQLKYKDEFVWEVAIIDDPNTLNAFATPGGYIYLYTGLIKFLDSEDQLIGVLGHEMAHADRRHSTRQLTKSLGISILLDAALGERDAVEQIVGQLAGLKFSRSHESEADEFSVKYLCNTSYKSDGAAGFFVKLQGQPTPPEFLSTHPSPDDRVEDMRKLAKELNCRGDMTNTSKYNEIKRLIPGV